jgi:hypothetical protein
LQLPHPDHWSEIMGGSLISDNWSLQNVAELLVDGPSDGIAEAIKVDKAAGTHALEPLPGSVVSFEALFDLITDIVLRDQLLVDNKFVSTWKGVSNDLDKLVENEIVRPIEFLAQPEQLDGPREEFVRRLCVTKSIKALHERNTRDWSRVQEVSDPLLSATLWGGAGMLARAFVSEKGYSPHPLRRRLFQQANIVLGVEDATSNLVGVIREKRASLSNSVFGGDSLYALRLSLPPIPMLVIREANSISQILPMAVQMRGEFQELRDWLRQYQAAISDSTFSERGRFEKVLRSISTYIESKKGFADSDSPTFTAGITALKVALKGNPIERLRNQFGVRSTANRLILFGTGIQEFHRLLRFFGHGNSELSAKLIEHFRMKD